MLIRERHQSFEATGCVPGLNGRLNPIRDTHDRTYLYASNIAINEGEQQPVHFIPGEDLRLTDAEGTELLVRIVDIVGRSALARPRMSSGTPTAPPKRRCRTVRRSR